IVAGASSYPRLIDYEQMADIAKSCSAFLMADMAHIAGLVAGGVIPSPVPHCDFVSFTTYKTLMGGRGGVVVCKKEHAKKLDRTIFPGAQGTPALNQVAAKAVCFKRALAPGFKTIQEKILENAACFAREFQKRGYHAVSGGTDTHLALIDLRSKGLSGDNAENILERGGIVLNRNVIPNDDRPPGAASGIRIGSPSITARGMGPEQVVRVVALIDAALMNQEDEAVLENVSNEVLALCKAHPAYGPRS
ncbi:MAG: serine hydroxymethyltransferase, partial [Desulfobacterales bacterium]|nr:serine hydroxymethyltransferase [Desulfobacterales bacterium]